MKVPVFAVAFALCGVSLVEASILPGVSDDGVPDLIVQGQNLTIDADGATITSYVIESTLGIFTGDAASNLGVFNEDTNSRISDSSSFSLTGSHSLGQVIGAEWASIDLFNDLTYTINSLFLRGDSNNDGLIDISDATNTLGYLFLGGPAPPVLSAADFNDDGGIDLTDPISTLEFLFLGSSPPPPPYPTAAPDPTPDTLDGTVIGTLIVIPEPTTFALSSLLCLTVGVVYRWRRRRATSGSLVLAGSCAELDPQVRTPVG